MGTVVHPRIRPDVLEDRVYQERIASSAFRQNTLVVLPTGLGKTAIALRVMAEFLNAHPSQSILLMAPTRPLVVQHGRSVESTLIGPAPIVLTGAIPPAQRAALLRPPQIIVATPQVVANDLTSGAFPLSALSLAIFDEAHRAVGDYPYVLIGERLREVPGVRILAVTASPGSQRRRVEAVWRNLSITHFELRAPDDPDVEPYTHHTGVEPVNVKIPEDVHRLASLLRNAYQRQTEELYRLNELPRVGGSVRDLLALGKELRRKIGHAKATGEALPPRVWQAVTAQAVGMKLHHASTLIETQGVEALRQFLRRQEELRPSPALRTFLRAPEVVEASQRLESLELEHPKVAKNVELVEEEITRHPNSRVIVFAHYRQTAERLVEEFRKHAGSLVRAERFVGQASRERDEGLSQKAQVEMLDRFRAGKINCLVATSVAEEGLDIPSTDLVVLYEPVPDEIRTIQRRGRTGRTQAGRVVVLLAEGTRDVPMWHAARAKERRMHQLLEEVEAESSRGDLPKPTPATVQRDLLDFAAE